MFYLKGSDYFSSRWVMKDFILKNKGILFSLTVRLQLYGTVSNIVPLGILYTFACSLFIIAPSAACWSRIEGTLGNVSLLGKVREDAAQCLSLTDNSFPKALTESIMCFGFVVDTDPIYKAVWPTALTEIVNKC